MVLRSPHRVVFVHAVAGVIGFVCWEMWGTKRPIIDLRVLATRAVGFGCLLAIRAIPIVILTIPIGQIANSSKIDPRSIIACGLAPAGSGVVGLGFRTTSDSDSLAVAPRLVCTPLLVALLRNVAPAESPKAGAFIGLALNLGGSIASASLVTLLDRRESFQSTILAAHATLANGEVDRFVSAHGVARLCRCVLRYRRFCDLDGTLRVRASENATAQRGKQNHAAGENGLKSAASNASLALPSSNS